MKSPWLNVVPALTCLCLLLPAACRKDQKVAPPPDPARDAAVDVPIGKPDTGRPEVSMGRPEVGACAETPAVTRANGQACTCHDECKSGNCVDGVCCNTACAGTCQACNVPGRPGTCSPVPEGMFPVVAGQCAGEPAATCGLDGRCDGRGACRRHPDGTVCLAGRCEEAKVVGARVCATGVCREAGTVNCAPYGCDPASNECFARCSADDQCSGTKCEAGSCGKKPLGAACAGTHDCESGICADGVCCNVSCTGPCLSCKEPGRLGRCSPVPAGNPDPHGVCTDEGASTCGQTGLCNGQGGCARYAAGSVCNPASCSGATLNPASVCDEDGSCVPGSPITCAPFLCAEGACRGSCQEDGQCLAPATCTGASCGPKGLGQPCAAAGECASNFCVDGVCCDSGCDGQCSFCALPNEPGRCTPVPAGALDPRASAGETDPTRACLDQGMGSCGRNGRCDGQGACQRYEEGAICQAESCDPATNRSSIGTCSAGSCLVSSRSCGPHLCNGDRCGIRCDSNVQCLPPNVCMEGSCGKRPDGEPCSENQPGECQSGICAQGVCCSTLCSGSCMSCALPKTAGVCTAVPAGMPDPAKVCVDQKPASCGTDGRCDGNGGCRRYAPGTLCSPATCRDAVATKASFCDAAGNCPPAATEACTPIIVCNGGGTACERTCTRDNQCLAGLKCFGGKCGLLDDGKACDENSDCKSKFCVDKVCCNTGCGGNNKNDCQTCLQREGASKDGVCTARVGLTCNDGSACTRTDTCVAAPGMPGGATCQGGNPVVCRPLDQCHVAGVCDPRTGACSNPNAPDSTMCNDNNACTEGDSCQGGTCRPGPLKMCAPADACRNYCDPMTGTCNPPKADGTNCNDGKLCTPGQDKCMAGVCTGRERVCNTPGPCQNAGACDATSGMCVYPPKMDGAECEAGNRCLTGDRCMGGVCREGATAVTCDSTTCKQCNPMTGTCTGANKPNNTMCTANRCLRNQTCRGGVCQGGSTVCTVPDCQVCDPATGMCSADASKEGMKCRDGNDCTGMETCRAGTCVAGTNKMCPTCQMCRPDDAVCVPIPGCMPPDAGMVTPASQ